MPRSWANVVLPTQGWPVRTSDGMDFVFLLLVGAGGIRWYCRGCKVDPADCRLPPPWLSNRNRHVNLAGRNRHTYRLL